MEEEKNNGCEGLGEGYKPYKVRYRLTIVETDIICIKEGDNTLDCVKEVMAVSYLEPCAFDVEILEKEEVGHIDG